MDWIFFDFREKLYKCDNEIKDMNNKPTNSKKLNETAYKAGLLMAGMKKLCLRLLLLIFLCCVITLDADACAGAAQNRIFPLGSCPQGIVVVEVHLGRWDVIVDDITIAEAKQTDFDIAWGGISYLKIYDKNYQTLSSEVIDSLEAFSAHPTEYNNIIEKTFDKGMKLAQKIPNFIPATPLSIWFCDYKKKSKKASLFHDVERNKLFVKLPNKNKYEIPFLEDKTAISAPVFSYYGFFNDDEEDIYELEMEMPKGVFYINSVRRFDLNGQKLTIVHLGTGDMLFKSKSKEYAPKFPFKDINHSIFVEPVLHHGRGFDFFILE